MRIIYGILGFISLGLGLVGVVLPILPTTPFLLLSAYLFAKSSQRLKLWFESTTVYKNHLESFVEERSMSKKTKWRILPFASFMLIIAFFMMNNIYGRIFIVCLIAFKYYYFIFRIQTKED